MQVHTSRTVLLVFDTLVKELCDLERTALTMGEGVYEVILRITNASRVVHPIPAVFFTHAHYLSLAFVLHPVDEVVPYPFILTVVNPASSILRKPKKKTKWSHRKDLILVGVNMNCTEQTTLVQE